MSEDAEFTVKRFQLATLCDWVMPAVPTGATLPVNQAFRVTMTPERLYVAASDRLRTVIAETPSVSTQSTARVYLPAKKLSSMLSAAPDGDFTVSVKAGTAAVRAGAASWTLKLPLEEGAIELPDLTSADFAPVGRAELLNALRTVQYAVGKGDGRPAFAQVRIAGPAGDPMYATAVGSSLMARARVPGFPFEVNVPGIVLADLVKLLTTSADKTVGVADAGSCLAFRAGPVTMAAQYQGAEFPDADGMFMSQVEGNGFELNVDRAELTKALRRAAINADSTTSAIGLIADCVDSRGSLTIMARDSAGNSAEEVIPATWTGPKRQTLVVNGKHLEHMLAAHPGATATFRVAANQGSRRAPLLLTDTEAGVTGICTQMPASQAGY